MVLGLNHNNVGKVMNSHYLDSWFESNYDSTHGGEGHAVWWEHTDLIVKAIRCRRVVSDHALQKRELQTRYRSEKSRGSNAGELVQIQS